MEVQQKIQTVLNVIDGKVPASELKPVIDDPSDVNVFKLAVDHIVGKVLQRQATGKVQFRFKLKEHGSESFTGWQPETTQFTTSMAMGQLRLQHPQAEISIERRY